MKGGICMRFIEGSSLLEMLSLMLDRKKMELKMLGDELKKLPAGDIVVRKSGKRLFFYREIGGVQKGITKNTNLCRALARKCVVRSKVISCEDDCAVLREAISMIVRLASAQKRKRREKTLVRIDAAFPDYCHRYRRDVVEWMTAPYRKSRFMPENLKYRTKSGIWVRSKSERSIADLLTELGIPFRYEAELVINGRTYYPDFLILCEDGTLIIWEHFGMVDDSEYFIKMCRKLDDYGKAGFRAHTNLICTYEEDMADEDALRGIIDRYILSRSL